MSRSFERTNELFSIRWEDGKVIFIDQTKLPSDLVFVETTSYERIAEAIKRLEVRGAPLIGVAAALALALVAYHSKGEGAEELLKELEKAAAHLKKTRPTAVNLFWALDTVLAEARRASSLGLDVRKAVVEKALSIMEADVETNRRIGQIGSSLIEDGDNVMTICNAGALATVAYGTALSVIRFAWYQGKNIHVFVPETRPLLQGSRLTAWELSYEGIPYTLITDNMAGYVFSKYKVDKVVVGADRILKDGTTYNKIGTYTIAVLARHHKVPFYVAAPSTTFDLESKVDDVVIEERSREEVLKIGGTYIAPRDANVLNPAFDMTPPEYIAAFITEKGIVKPPFEENIAKTVGGARE